MAASKSSASKKSGVGRKGGKSGSYENWTVDELRKKANEVGIRGRSNMKKKELVSALRLAGR